MKSKYKKIMWMMLIIFSTSTPIMSQTLCSGESEEGGVGNTKFSTRISDIDSDFVVDESDMLGSELLTDSPITTESISEIAIESIEFGAAEVVPGVDLFAASFGLMVDLVAHIILDDIIFLQEKIHKEMADQRRLASEVKESNKSHGDFLLPLVPNFSIAVEDLDGDANKLSYMFFLKKSINSIDVKHYLEKHGKTDYIDKTFPLCYQSGPIECFDPNSRGLTERMPFAFSEHIYYYSEPYIVLNAAGDEFVRYNLRADNFKRSITDIDFSIQTNAQNINIANTKIKSYWKLTNANGVTSDKTKIKESPLKLVLATKDDENGYTELGTIPYTATTVNDKIAIKVSEYNIIAHSGKPLFVLVKADAYKYYGEATFLNADGTRPHHFPLDPYTNEPGVEERTIAYFKVHDYQPKDNQNSTEAKMSSGKEKDINHFPIIHTSTRTEYGSTPIKSPDFGKSHLRLGIPVKSTWKHMEYVELELLNRDMTAIVNFDKDNNGDITTTAYYNTASSTNNSLPVNRIINANTASASLTNANDPFSVTKSIDTLYFLVQDVPINIGDIVNTSAYYEDGSVSRDVFINSSGKTIPRAYYQLQNNNGKYLFNNVSTNELSYESTASEWLIEHQGAGLYAIMDKTSKKVLGIKNGVLNLYHWNPDDNNLLWDIKFIDNDTMKLINIGQKAFLSGQNSIGFNFSDGLEITFNKVANADKVLYWETKYQLTNRLTDMTLDVSGEGAPIFNILNKINYEHNNQFLNFEYRGCMSYAIYNYKTQKSLYYDVQNGLKWSDTEETAWLLNSINDNYFTLSSMGKVLFPTSGEDLIDAKLTEPLSNEYGYQFTFSTYKFPDLIAHYALNDNVNDSSDYHHHGAEFGGITYVNDSNRGIVVQLDGTNDYVDTQFDYNPANYDRKLTTSFWMKQSNRNTTGGLIDFPSFSIIKESSNSVRTIFYQDESSGPQLSGNITDNEWHHIVVVLDRQVDNSILNKMYIDGVKVSELTMTTPPFQRTTVPTTTIGLHKRYRTGSTEEKYFNGLIDDIKIWKKALTESEIQNIYQPTLPSTNLKSTNTSKSRKEILVTDKKNNVLKNLTISPNPSDGNFDLSLSLTERSDVNYRIVNFSGQTLHSGSKTFNTGSHVWNIATNRLQGGIYFIEVFARGWKEARKIVINKP